MGQSYQIKSGDSLSVIAARYHTTVAELARANGISDPNKIHAGDRLNIPHRHSTEGVAKGADGALPEEVPMPAPRPGRPDRPGARPERPLGQDNVSLSTAPGLSARDTEALIRAVAAEARGESPAAWAAVAQCIINYGRKNDIPIARLVRTSYLSSNFDGNRVYYTRPLSRIPNLAGIRAAVNEAAQGRSPIGDRSHFHDTSIRTPSFGDRSTAYRLGHLVFYNAK